MCSFYFPWLILLVGLFGIIPLVLSALTNCHLWYSTLYFVFHVTGAGYISCWFTVFLMALFPALFGVGSLCCFEWINLWWDRLHPITSLIEDDPKSVINFDMEINLWHLLFKVSEELPLFEKCIEISELAHISVIHSILAAIFTV